MRPASTTGSDSAFDTVAGFRILSAGSSTAELLLDLDGGILAANGPLSRLLGRAREEIEGTRITELTADPEPRVSQYLRRVGRTAAPLPGTLDVANADGEVISCRCEGARVNAPDGRGEPAIVLRLMPRATASSRFTMLTKKVVDLRREIARRRNAELLLERQKDLLELIVRNVPLADVLGAIASFVEKHSERCLCSILLLDKSGKRLLLGAAPSLPAAYNEAIDGLEIGPEVGSCGSAAYLAKKVVVEDIASDPRWQPFKALAAEHGLAACWSSPVKGPEDRVLGTLAMYYREPGGPSADDLYLTSIGVDLTAIAILSERSRATLRLRAEQLAEADRRKDRFLAMLSHELRNPLAPIVNTLEVVGAEAENPELLAHIDRLKRQTTHLSRLVDDLLDISRIAHGAVELKIETVDVRECVRQAVDSCRELMLERGQSLIVPDEKEPIWVSGDSGRLRQIFSNLLTNAAKYTPTGGKIEIGIETGERTVSVHVRDNGQGISREVRSHLFEPFRQGANSALDSREGLGLGLALVKQLVECHGGEIEVESEGVGLGSEFTATLPLAVSPKAATGSRSSEGSDPAQRTRLEILVAEDNRDSAEALSTLLRLWGHQARICYDGDDAVRRALELRPDVLILDIDLPGRDGYKVLQALRQQGFSTENRLALAMTGFGRLGDIEESKAAGFHHHLTKPADPSYLRQLLSDFASERRARVDGSA